MKKEIILDKDKEFEIFDTRRIVKTLEDLMSNVTSKEINANTVNSACNCADKIVDILRLHLDVERLRSRFNPKRFVE